MNQQHSNEIPDKPQLLIVGASTRAAAFSALRAGYQPVCVDQYADQDLREIAEVIPKVDACTEWLEPLLQRPSMEWIYTGAMENHPELIEQISQKHQLRGCDPVVLKRVRNPFFLEQILSQNTIQAAPCRPSDSSVNEDEKWLSKPFKGAAGHDIRFTDSDSSTALKTRYLQRYQPGIPISALFISFRQTTVLVGVSLQFIGKTAFNAAPFQFCGGATLSPILPWLKDALEETGQTISKECQIQGLFGCDFLLNPDQEQEIWLNEVNPRYTALTELFELRYHLPLLDWHIAACRSFETSQTGKKPPEQLQSQLLQLENRQFPQICKGILYAAKEIQCRELEGKQFSEENCYQIPKSADIPCLETIIPAGSPICSIFGVGDNLTSSLQTLTERVIFYEQSFEPDRNPSKIRSEILNMFGPLKKIEKLYFSGFSPSWNETRSFLED